VTAPIAVLVGPPGAGKTTVGRALAASLGVAFRDTDADVEKAAGTTVADIFITHGEEHFRELEREAVRTALAEHEGVLALGGGAVLDAGTRSRLAGHRVVFLSVGLTDAAARVGMNQARPLLLGNPRAQLHRLLEERRLLYQEVATVIVVTDGIKVDEVVSLTLESLGLNAT
jgi:shikimate kinase